MKSLSARQWLPQPRPINPAFSTWLDCFRWLAALAVCLAHTRAGLMEDFNPQMQPGWLAVAAYWFPGFAHSAVMVFFVLSGYLVGGEILRGLQRGDFSWRIYASRRLSRLYAGYLAALLLGGLIDLIGSHYFKAQLLYNLQDNFVTVITYSVIDRLNFATLAGNLVFCQTLLVPTFGSNGVLWSLANEAWYYALVPLALWPLFSRGSTWGRILGLSLFATGAWFVRGDLLLYMTVWLIGLVPHALPRPILSRSWLPWAGFLALLCLGRLHWYERFTQWQFDVILAGSFALLLNTLEHQARPAPGPAGWHRELAGFSYTVYLAHWPLALFIIAGFNQITGSFYRLPFSLAAASLVFLLTIVIYAYCWALAQFTEHQTLRIRTWLLALIPPGRPTAP